MTNYFDTYRNIEKTRVLLRECNINDDVLDDHLCDVLDDVWDKLNYTEKAVIDNKYIPMKLDKL